MRSAGGLLFAQSQDLASTARWRKEVVRLYKMAQFRRGRLRYFESALGEVERS